jgi:protein-tyrosine phosphatase
MKSFFRSLIDSPQPIEVGRLLRMDMHAHWLPGIDDGAGTPEDTMGLVGHLYDLGYRRLIATPHVYPDLYDNTPATIRAAFESVAPDIRATWPELEIGYAAEYFVDERFDNLIAERKLLTWQDERVLVEFSFLDKPPFASESLFQLGLRGYRPVLAHVERYPYFYQDDKILQLFRDMGVEFQGNLLSFTGYYGPDVQRQAERLLRAGWYEWLGTDIHHQRHAGSLLGFKVGKKIVALLRQTAFLNQSV